MYMSEHVHFFTDACGHVHVYVHVHTHVHVYVCACAFVYADACGHAHVYVLYTRTCIPTRACAGICNPFIRLLKVLLLIKTPQPKSKLF